MHSPPGRGDAAHVAVAQLGCDLSATSAAHSAHMHVPACLPAACATQTGAAAQALSLSLLPYPSFALRYSRLAIRRTSDYSSLLLARTAFARSCWPWCSAAIPVAQVQLTISPPRLRRARRPSVDPVAAPPSVGVCRFRLGHGELSAESQSDSNAQRSTPNVQFSPFGRASAVRATVGRSPPPSASAGRFCTWTLSPVRLTLNAQNRTPTCSLRPSAHQIHNNARRPKRDFGCYAP